MVTVCSLSLMLLKSSMYRIGFSKDIHRLVLNRRLMLGGVHVPSVFGEQAHSDGDVVYHAVAESILGALALGDLGKYFPDTSTKTENMDSRDIVNHVYGMMRDLRYRVVNVDVTIVLENPKIGPYIDKMRSNIAILLGIHKDDVSVKAGTNEGCGEVGAGAAVEAFSTVLLRKDS